jgi:hypothetical protein
LFQVRPDLFEVGGVYSNTKDASGNSKRSGPGKSMTVSDIKNRFPTYETSALPQDGGWYQGRWEDDTAARARLVNVATWLKTLQPELGDDGVAVLVVHGHFMDLLAKVHAHHAFTAPGAFPMCQLTLSAYSLAKALMESRLDYDGITSPDKNGMGK